MSEEQVLVIDTKIVNDLNLRSDINIINDFHLDVDKKIYFNTSELLNKMNEPGIMKFIDRKFAENDPSMKQLIPYVIMYNKNGTYLVYRRGKKSGESRLVGNYSMGIGGHINPCDDKIGSSPLDMYNEALKREINEEIKVDILPESHWNPIAIINDNSNEVGKVHLGLVHLIRIDKEGASNEDQILDVQFKKISELAEIYHEMETWSQLCLLHLSHLRVLSNTMT